MKRRICSLALAAVAFGLVWPGETRAQTLNYLDGRPLSQVIKTPVANCGSFRQLPVSVIAWGADIVASLANGNAKVTAQGSVFAANKLDIRLYRQDDFKQQVEDFLACKTPILRGTMGMLNQAIEVLARDPRTAPIVVYQYSWSVGGDLLVVKEEIKTPADLCGKTVAVQAYGPHVDYVAKISADACGGNPAAIKVKWLKDLQQTDQKSVSPVVAIKLDPTIVGAFVITPDAMALTRQGKVGDGSEDSLKGARILLSTKTASRIIADVYVVRSDYFQARRDDIERFVNGLMRAEEALREVMKSGKGDLFKQATTAAAELLLDSPTAVNDLVGMYGDAELVNYGANVKFFTDSANPRGFDKLASEIQASLMALGLIAKQVPVAHAKWDYAKLAVGLTDTKGVELPRFVPEAVQSIVEKRAKTPGTEAPLMPPFEIYFAANQNVFPAEQYKASFDKVIELVSTYGGAIMAIEGHSDPLGYLREKKSQTPPMVLGQIRQASRNLSYSRANAVKDAIIAYAKSKGVSIDASQFGIIGFGVSQPNTPRCKLDSAGDIALSCAPATEQEWNATRRVVFKIIQVEAETAVFKPL